MAPVFVFAEDVEKALREGKKQIEIPEGARISAAALDLIRDRKIKIVYKDAKTSAAQALLSADQAEPGEGARGDEAAREAPPTEPAARDAISTEISDEELEDIVNRVIRRFRQAKGEAPLEPTGKGKGPEADDDLVICRCEEVTKGEIKEAIRNGMRTLNGVKRITRAGMGLCQGQTCQRLVSQILAEELGIPPVEVEPTTTRAPVRPVRFSVFASG
jgi:bacterioferritin-associated ferredoxin